MVSILIISYGREKELLETLSFINQYRGEKIEVLFLDNNETNFLEDKIIDIFRNNNSINLIYFNDGINYGVARGRNYLIKRASRDILITLDDDIEIENITVLVDRVKYYFNNHENVGVLAFNIKNFYTRKALSHEIPHGNKKLNFDNNMFTYYFIGAGHAIRKNVYDKVGYYPLDLGLYGGEERDLSFRILEFGYDILYVSDIVIFHKISPNGRMPREKENFYRYRNQLIVLNRYMPFLYCVTSNIIWSIFYLLRKKGSLYDIYTVFLELVTLDKTKVSHNVIKKIGSLKGRVLY